jgi:hypothetical protein
VSETIIITSCLACAVLAVYSVPPYEVFGKRTTGRCGSGRQSELVSKLERQRVRVTSPRNGPRTNSVLRARPSHLGFGGIPERAKGHAPAAGLLSRGQQR